MISTTVSKYIKSIFNLVGLDVIRQKNSPKLTLLGLNTRSIVAVIDVGANTGQFAKHISGFFPNAKIYCFEPLPVAFAALKAWAQTQNGRVIPYNLAIGDMEGETEMFLHEEHTPSSSLLVTTSLTGQYYPITKEQKRISIKQTKLDVVLGDICLQLSSEILIKIDVQGYENRVIAGGKSIFAKAAACIIEVNVDKLYEGQAVFLELHSMLDSLGYQYVGNLEQSYAKDGHCIYLDAVFLNRNVPIRENP
jgi:FkbM family methyltransferase